MSKVSVLDTNKKVLEPCHPAQARRLLKSGKAAVWRRYPFTIILKHEVAEPSTTDYQLCIDPGSRMTGIAILSLSPKSGRNIVFAANLEHRGQTIKKSLQTRSGFRRSRRTRKIRYREPRWDNRKRGAMFLVDGKWQAERQGDHGKGWIAPSLMSRVYNIHTWASRLTKLYPITSIAYELVKFDTQLIDNPDISGVEYQHGTLFGYEVKEYLLEKHQHKCAYCGVKNVPLQIDHIHPKSKGGSNRVGNLAIACEPCNKKKGSTMPDDIEDDKLRKAVKRTKSRESRSLADMSVVNTIRWKVFGALESFGLPVVTGTGGKTKRNRIESGLPKTHYFDAACVAGRVYSHEYQNTALAILNIKAKGYGQRDLFKFSAGENKNKIRLKGKKNAKQKSHGFIVGGKKITASGGFNKYDHIIAHKKKGVSYVGIINCFLCKKSADGSQMLMIESPDVDRADHRTSGQTSELELLMRRDGYYFSTFLQKWC